MSMVTRTKTGRWANPSGEMIERPPGEDAEEAMGSGAIDPEWIDKVCKAISEAVGIDLFRKGDD